MNVILQDDILLINYDDLPKYKKGGSVVRNSYLWALKSISCYTPWEKDWEYDRDVWVAYPRMLLSFAESGYLGDREVMLKFSENTPIPEELSSVATWL